MFTLLSFIARSPPVDCFAVRSQRHLQVAQFHSSVVCRLNRFLFDPSEVNSDANTPTVTLPADDYRTVHASTILGLNDGDSVRAGLVSCEAHDGLVTDEAVVRWGSEGSLQIHLHGLTSSPLYERETNVSLILALPRPLQLGRMLPMISQLGVDHLVLTSSRKVPKDYFGSHLFREPDALRRRLVEGLCQAGDVKLPRLHIVRNLSRFLDDDLDVLFPSEEYARVIAHPRSRDSDSPQRRMRNVQFPTNPPRMVIAVGPDGGWMEPKELDRFQSHGFVQITLGRRVLRSDVAVVSLLSLAHDVCDSHAHHVNKPVQFIV